MRREAPTRWRPCRRHQLRSDGGKPVEVWTPTVVGEQVTVELYLPPGANPDGVRLAVPLLSHLDADPKTLSNIGDAACLQVDVACAADRISDVTRRAVAKYVFTTSSGGSSACTGTLLNDADPHSQIPYFYTARHCIENAAEAASMEFYWFFERAACGGPDPETVVRQTGGAVELAFDDLNISGTSTDQLLLRLLTPPPEGVGMAGWTTSPVSAANPAVGVHHPAGDLKKLTGQSVDGFASWKHFWLMGGSGDGDTHVHTIAEVPTEPGSSGSGLFTRVDGEDYLVGALTGGSAECSDSDDYYGRLARFYPKVRQWLGPPGDVGNSDGRQAVVHRLALVDAVSRAELADLTRGGTLVDLDLVASRSFDIVAETRGPIARVEMALAGPRQARHVSATAPHTVFGPAGGGGLAPGSYAVTIRAYAASAPAADVAWEGVVPFTVIGTAGEGGAVAGLTLAVGSAPRLVDLAHGTAVTLYPGEKVGLWARTAGGGALGSVAFAINGPSPASRTVNDAPYGMETSLAPGTYRIAATPTRRPTPAATPRCPDPVPHQRDGCPQPDRRLHAGRRGGAAARTRTSARSRTEPPSISR